jgi:hypothetical protein
MMTALRFPQAAVMRNSSSLELERPDVAGEERRQPVVQRVFWLADYAEAPLTPDMRLGGLLLELIDPYVEEDISVEIYTKVLILGVLAWNLTLLPAEEGRKMVAATVAVPLAEEEDALTEFLDELVLRKRQHWPDEATLIARVGTRLEPDGSLYLDVASPGKQF